MFEATGLLLGPSFSGRVKSLPQKTKSRLIKFEIVEFYPSISEELPNRCISFARSITTITQSLILSITQENLSFSIKHPHGKERK